MLQLAEIPSLRIHVPKKKKRKCIVTNEEKKHFDEVNVKYFCVVFFFF